jgi:predicted Zn-dependent protease with MMP-like domain
MRDRTDFTRATLATGPGAQCGERRGAAGDTVRHVDAPADPLDRFEDLVAEAVAGIPEPFASALDDVVLVVEDHARGRSLYGLYEGHPITTGTIPSGAMPPRITIYMRPMAEHFRDPAELRHQVRVTVLHELGHHMGLDEDRLDELGYA